MLKLHQIYFKLFLGLFLLLFVVVALEGYFFKYFNFLLVLSLTFIIFGAIFYVLMSEISNNLQNEVSKIIKFLSNLTKKQKQETITSNYSQELKYITKLISKIAHILLKQASYKENYTKKLESLNTQKDEIISAISHEFKNPIAIISGYSQTLLKDENLPKSLQKKFLEKIYKQGEKLTQLIDTLRLAIKLDENKQTLNFREVDIYELVLDVVDDLKYNYKRDIKVLGNRVVLRVDKVLFEVMIKNLIENGIKYSEDEVVVIVNDSFISVIDKGIGISENEIDKITQKFYRVSNNNWNNSLGLGLSIVNNIIKLHKFKLEINSELNKGSEFKVRF